MTLVLGVDWDFPEHLVRTAAGLAGALEQHLVCAFVDPATNEEAVFPSGELLRGLEAILGKPGDSWSFRVLNGDVPKALGRLAESTGASLVIVGADRPGAAAWVDRLLSGSVWGTLASRGQWPVLIVPDQH